MQIEPRTKEEKVLEYVKAHGSISNAQCRELLSISRDQADWLLKRLVNNELLQRVGEKRGSRYIFPPGTTEIDEAVMR